MSIKCCEKSKIFLKVIIIIVVIVMIKNDLYYAFVHVHGWYSNLVNLLTIEDKLNVMRIEAWKLNELVSFLVSSLNNWGSK